jgi:hypothetical protein
MQSFIKAIDGLPLVAKIILCLFGLDIVWAVYRIVKGIDKKDNFLLIVGIIWLIGAISVAWIIDLVTVILNKDNPILT